MKLWILFFILLVIAITIYVFRLSEKKQISNYSPFQNRELLNSENYLFNMKIIPIKPNNEKINFIYTNNKNTQGNIKQDSINILLKTGGTWKDFSTVNVIISSIKQDHEQNKKKCIYVPKWSIALTCLTEYSVTDLLLPMKFVKKSKFCLYFPSENPEQQNFVKKLQLAYPEKNIDSFQQKYTSLSRMSDKEKYKNILDFCKDYKYIIVYEDKFVSENFLIPLLAGCVVIYNGPDEVSSHFNSCFINIKNFDSLDTCIYQIKNEDSYKYFSIPILNREMLNETVAWYFGTSNFYEILYRNIPSIRCNAYTPITNWESDPAKPIKFINLDKSKDRLNSIQKFFRENSHNLQYERFPGILIDELSPDILEKSTYKKCVRQLKKGEIGLFLSTLEISYALTRDVQNDSYIILEDDAQFTDLREPKFYIDKAPKDWDIIFLGVNKYFCLYKKVKHSDYIRWDHRCIPGTFGYIIRKRTAQYLVNHGLPTQVPIDDFWGLNVPNLNIYYYNYNVVDVDYNNNTTVSNTQIIN